MKSLYLLCICFCCANALKGSPLVSTNTGSILGTYVDVLDTDVVAFLGIPYAKPPVGDLRFTKPEPIEPWEGILQADTKPPPCMQYHTENYVWNPVTTPSEDCLFLNVWSVPRRCSGAKDKLPVMVWIHGGGFTGGSTDIPLYDGSLIASRGEVIVVSMNYRLGIFGFLNGGTKELSGNAGLYDQTMALEWVKNNIEFFGGDPESVTLFGESAGSMCISLHMVSPLSKNLFKRAILQSGTIYNSLMTDSSEVAVKKTDSFAKSVGCSNGAATKASEVIKCLRKKDALELSKTENEIKKRGTIFFMPSYGDPFLPKSLIKAAESGEIAQKDVLIGGTKDEGTLFLCIQMPEMFTVSKSPKLDIDQAKKIILTQFKSMSEQVSNVYLKTAKKGATATEAVAMTMADFIFNCPMMFFTEKLDNAYMYWLTHRSQKDTNADWMGVPHFYDVPYVFGAPVIDTQNYTPEDKNFSLDLMQKWINFARNGHPLPNESKHLWPKFSTSNQIAMELNPKKSGTIPFPRQKICNEFWRSMLIPNSV